MSKIDFNVKLFSLTGEPLEIMRKKKGKEETVPMTLGNACSDVMLNMLDTDRTESGKSRYERWLLAGKIINAEKAKESIDLLSEEVTQIKERVGQAYSPVVVGPVYELLEGKVNKNSKDNETNEAGDALRKLKG